MSQPDTPCHTMSQVVTREGNTKLRVRRTTFTLHNYNVTNVTHILNYCNEHHWEVLFSEELGKSGVTPHLQGYLQSKNAIRFDTLKNFLPTAHWEKARGTLQQNITYIKKEGGNFHCNFELPFQETPKPTINPNCFTRWIDCML